MNKELIIQKYVNDKKSILQISNETNISRYFIKKYLKENNIKIRSAKETSIIANKNKTIHNKYDNDIIEKYQNGLSMLKISKIYKKSRPSIKKNIRK